MIKFKNVLITFIIWFVTVFIVKFAFNKFSFSIDVLVDSLMMSLGFIVGWYGYQYFHDKVSKK